jgi:hypothetical protein
LFFPPPADVDLNDFAVLQELTLTAPIGVLLWVLAAWLIGTFAGAWVAARVAGCCPLVHGLMLGALFLLAAVATLVMIPHPLWFQIVSVLLFLPAAYLGARSAATGRAAAQKDVAVA